MVAAVSTGQDSQASLTGSEKPLVDAYIAATRSHDVDAIKRLLHPKALACITPDNVDFYTVMFESLASRRVPERFDLKVTAVDPAMLSGRAAFYWGPDSSLPVIPQREISIRYSQKADAARQGCRKFHLVADTQMIHLLDVVEDGGQARLVVGCVGAQTLERFRKKPEEEAKAADRVRTLFQQLSPELKQRLAALVKAGQTVSAIQTYQAESKQSMSDANRVVDMLCDEL